MNKVFDYKKFYEEASKSPRLTTLYNKFESISEGLEQRPITIPKVDDAYLVYPILLKNILELIRLYSNTLNIRTLQKRIP